jgi:hypothetical protein
MSQATISSAFAECLEDEFPAPLCEVCEVPMRASTRVFYNMTPRVVDLIGFQCGGCGHALRFPSPRRIARNNTRVTILRAANTVHQTRPR